MEFSKEAVDYGKSLAKDADLDEELQQLVNDKKCWEGKVDETQRILDNYPALETELLNKKEHLNTELVKANGKVEVVRTDPAKEQELEVEVGVLANKTGTANETVSAKTVDEERIKNELKNWNDKINQTSAEIKNLEELSRISEEKQNNLTGEINAIYSANRTDSGDAFERIQDMIARKGACQNETESIKNDINSVKANQTYLETQRDASVKELNELKIEEARQHLNQLVKDHIQKQNDLQDHRSLVKIARNGLADAEKKVKDFTEMIRNVEANLTTVCNKLDEARRESDQLNHNLNLAREKIRYVNSRKREKEMATETSTQGTTENSTEVGAEVSVGEGDKPSSLEIGVIVGSAVVGFLIMATIILGILACLKKLPCQKKKNEKEVESPKVADKTEPPPVASPALPDVPPNAPNDAATPAPTDAAPPASTDTAPPAPTDAVPPSPTDAATPAPTDAAPSAPADAAPPAPTGVAAPVPTDIATPAPVVDPAPLPSPATADIADCKPFEVSPVSVKELTPDNAVFKELSDDMRIGTTLSDTHLPPPADYSSSVASISNYPSAPTSFSNVIYRTTERICSMVRHVDDCCHTGVTPFDAAFRIIPPWTSNMEKAKKVWKPAEKRNDEVAVNVEVYKDLVLAMSQNEMGVQGEIPVGRLINLLVQAKDKMMALKTMTTLPGHSVVISSLEGHVPHLIRILALFDNTNSPDNISTFNIVFNGTAIYGGAPYGSLMCLSYILILMSISPNKVVWLRGSTEKCTRFLNPLSELLADKYGEEDRDIILGKLEDLFNSLPLMAQVGSHLTIPGGPPKKMFTMEELNAITRPIANHNDHPIASGTMASIRDTQESPNNAPSSIREYTSLMDKDKPRYCGVDVPAGPDRQADSLFSESIYYGEQQAKELCSLVNCSSIITGRGRIHDEEAYRLVPGSPGCPSTLILKAGREHKPGVVYVDESGTGHIIVAAPPKHYILQCCGDFENQKKEGGASEMSGVLAASSALSDVTW